jgi:alcohol dehydrogenase (NADP+)
MVPGHEIAGIVSQVGAKVTRYKVGDRMGVGISLIPAGSAEYDNNECINATSWSTEYDNNECLKDEYYSSPWGMG